jgi:predicted DCC family thiol-disulfide oxidoreductase YuxK
MATAQKPAIVLFDGVCNFCNASINFILQRDRRGDFQFASLQSEAGRRLISEAGLHDHDLDSMVLIEGDRVSVKSTAALRSAKRLPGLWPLAGLLLFIPRVIRDGCYDAFAARRYRWFGKQEACMVPTAEMRSRFIEDAQSS